MEALLVGVLTGLTAVVGVAYWQSLVRPEGLLALWSDPRVMHPWVDQHPGPVRALRCALGTVLALCGFLTGLTVTFLMRT